MKILVLGASKGTGALVVGEALARGNEVTAFARHPERLQLAGSRLRKVPGDFHDAASVKSAVAGHDAVVVTASASSLAAFKARPDYFSLGTGHAIVAMKALGVRRLVVLSALGTGESRALMPWLARKLVVDLILRRPFADHEVQEGLVRASDLDWVIARPGRLTNGPARHAYLKRTDLGALPGAISRADVAHFLVEACERDSWLQQAVQLGG
jgi:putative NADH-flavin reductase